MTASANDTQHGGDHYKKLGQFQPWDVLQAWLTPEEYRGWQKGVAIVYLARERDKGGDEDIMKAGHHLTKLIEVMQKAGFEKSLEQAMTNSEQTTGQAQRKLDKEAWAEVLATEQDGISLAQDRTTTFSDKVKVLSPEGRATYSGVVAECLADMVFLKKRLTDIDRNEPDRFIQSIRRLDGAITLLNHLAPLFAEPAE